MKIKTSNKEIEVKSILGEQLRSGTHEYPSLKIVMPKDITQEEIDALLEGSFIIVDDENNEYKHIGYNTLKEVSITIAAITSDEQKIEDLEAKLAEAERKLEEALAKQETPKEE